MKELFPHQNNGSLFLQLNKRALLADDMGLGKTIQTIDAMRELGLTRAAIVCPSGAKFNWADELAEEGYSSKIMNKLTEVPDADICIGSFEYWSAYARYCESNDIARTWHVLIIDEGHMLKEPSSQRTKNILGSKGLIHRCGRTWALSGTPAPNHAGELWVWLRTFGHTKLSYEGFIARYCNAHHAGDHYSRVQIEGTKVSMAHELKAMLKQFSLRRLKKNVLNLPPIFHSTYSIEGTPDKEIFARYPELEQQMKEELILLEEKMDIDHNDTESFLSVLSFLSGSISSLRRYHGLKKVMGVAKVIKNELQEGQYKKIVIFGVHTSVLTLLKKELEEFNPVIITGATTDRETPVKTFQNDENCGVFLGNIKAAGTAITLTAAHQVGFIEDDWVPGNNDQATDRVYRIGTTETVFCRHFSIRDSLDEKVTRTLVRKTQELSTFIEKR